VKKVVTRGKGPIAERGRLSGPFLLGTQKERSHRGQPCKTRETRGPRSEGGLRRKGGKMESTKLPRAAEKWGARGPL